MTVEEVIAMVDDSILGCRTEIEQSTMEDDGVTDIYEQLVEQGVDVTSIWISYGSAEARLEPYDSYTYVLSGLYVEPAQRKQHHATALLRRVVQAADATNTALRLTVEPLADAPMNVYELYAWYSRFGFERVGLGWDMRREPGLAG